MGEKQAPDAFPREAAAVRTGLVKNFNLQKTGRERDKTTTTTLTLSKTGPARGRVKRETRGQGTLPNQPAAQKTRRRTRKFPPFIKKGGDGREKEHPFPPLFKGPEEFSTYSIPSTVFSFSPPPLFYNCSPRT